MTQSERINISKSQLAIALSKLEVFNSPKIKAEQYPTDPEIAAEILWNSYMIDGFLGKVSVDLGCGTGILGIGMLILGVNKAFLVDNDPEALKIAKNNLESLKNSFTSISKRGVIVQSDVKDYEKKADIVVQNPPFGSKVRHQDTIFLEKAFKIAPIVYSFHKAGNENYLKKLAKEHEFSITHKFNLDFALKCTMKYHKRKIHRIKVECYRFERQKK